MKTRIFCWLTSLVLLPLAATETAQIARYRNGLIVSSPTPAFVAALESSARPNGPWIEEAQSWFPCAAPHFFTVPGMEAVEFYRIRFMDNGVVPTPYAVQATVTRTNTVLVQCALLLRCDDSQLGPFRVYRTSEGENDAYIGETGNASVFFLDPEPPSGMVSYRMQAIDGEEASWLSYSSNLIQLP